MKTKEINKLARDMKAECMLRDICNTTGASQAENCKFINKCKKLGVRILPALLSTTELAQELEAVGDELSKAPRNGLW